MSDQIPQAFYSCLSDMQKRPSSIDQLNREMDMEHCRLKKVQTFLSSTTNQTLLKKSTLKKDFRSITNQLFVKLDEQDNLATLTSTLGRNNLLKKTIYEGIETILMSEPSPQKQPTKKQESVDPLDVFLNLVEDQTQQPASTQSNMTLSSSELPQNKSQELKDKETELRNMKKSRTDAKSSIAQNKKTIWRQEGTGGQDSQLVPNIPAPIYQPCFPRLPILPSMAADYTQQELRHMNVVREYPPFNQYFRTDGVNCFACFNGQIADVLICQAPQLDNATFQFGLCSSVIDYQYAYPYKLNEVRAIYPKGTCSVKCDASRYESDNKQQYPGYFHGACQYCGQLYSKNPDKISHADNFVKAGVIPDMVLQMNQWSWFDAGFDQSLIHQDQRTKNRIPAKIKLYKTYLADKNLDQLEATTIAQQKLQSVGKVGDELIRETNLAIARLQEMSQAKYKFKA